ncbi:MAG: FxDxF family PEP-CTERM protein [Spongiibacteraceae bacterium]
MVSVSKFLGSTVAAMALSTMAASNASAAIYNLGEVSDGFSYTNVAYHLPSSTAFSDLFTFSVPTSYTADISSFVQDLTIFGIFFDVKNLKLELDGVAADAGSTKTSKSFTDLAGGDYAFEVTGKSKGLLGGAYKFNMTANLSPIPEPATYAMLLAGLGLVGVMARRRSSLLK